ncbi:hypothetical protein MB02_07835 [Croceicoccus estronivorus]|uniref:TetR/AcrR family transcriptional regulator n=1 Tax=Croceicoccus estronivorus TaxID=1172626 RepID=UPI0008328027|nr:TetR/AcrR family transcriptional regulator [Croceicoccus estronivorus]OCC24168.1 hypothetical protein MB02_07835 [Croceicoccus estronivorus]
MALAKIFGASGSMSGRPVSYQRDAVVDGAMVEFWSRGFGASDVATLTQATGLNRHSLYKSFAGKRGLFLDTLQHYIDVVAVAYVRVLEEGSGLDDIVAYFEHASRQRECLAETDDPPGFDQRGCFLVNTAIELGRTDAAVARLLDEYYARIERAFAGLIVRGQQSGSIRSDLDPETTARWLRVTSQGLSVSSRLGAMPVDIAMIVRTALSQPNK